MARDARHRAPVRQRAVLRPDADGDLGAVGDAGRGGLQSACVATDLDAHRAAVAVLATPRSTLICGSPTNCGDEQVGRVVEHLVGGAELLDDAGVHHREPVGQRQRLDLVVGDDDGGVAELALQHLQLAAHPLARRGVEVAQRLVEQQHRRVADQRAGQRDPLLLAAGQAGGPQLEQVVHLQPLG